MGRKLKVKEQQREAALEFVNENPGVLARDIIVGLGWSIETGCKRLQMMCFLNELRREPVIVDSAASPDRRRVVRTFRYWALRDEIQEPETVEILLAEANDKSAKVPVEKVHRPGVTSNTDPSRKPIPNQGGGQLGQGYGPKGFSSITLLD